MEFLNYKLIKAKLKKKGILFKKPSYEDASFQFYLLARQLDDHKLYSGYCHLAIANCQMKQNASNNSNAANNNQVGALLNAARSFSKAEYEIISTRDHIRAVIWIYTEALLQCDRSFRKLIYLEMAKFYESHQMYEQAADCYKQSLSISRCVQNLILSHRYKSALDELKGCPSHLMSTKDYTSMFLLELLLNDNDQKSNLKSLQNLSSNSAKITSKGVLPIDDNLFDLNCLLESLLVNRNDNKIFKISGDAIAIKKNTEIRNSIVDRLSAFLDPAQIELLHLVSNNC